MTTAIERSSQAGRGRPDSLPALQPDRLRDLDRDQADQTRQQIDGVPPDQVRRAGGGHHPYVKWGNRAPKLLRVQFYVDRQKGKLVIGYCGDHLTTRRRG